MTGDLRIEVPVLARVEGEGALHVTTEGGRVTDVRLRIYEPPRFFEGVLRGRGIAEAPDITARICGICPVAYQTAACNAAERIGGVEVSEPIRLARRLLYCGEWIESHALHVVMLHLPDFLGYAGGLEMAREHRDLVATGLRLKKAGNDLMALLGGRAVHPVSVRVGGFTALPDATTLRAFAPVLAQAERDVAALAEVVLGLEYPDLQVPYTFFALDAGPPSQPAVEYPLQDGRLLVFGDGRGPMGRIALAEFDEHVREIQELHSTALHARLDGQRYLVGPLARWALLGDRLAPGALALAERLQLERPCTNPFRSILVRTVELQHAVEEALRVIDALAGCQESARRSGDSVAAFVDVPTAAGTGYGASEAPRGLLVHRYRTTADGTIADARIVPPTSQNQAQLEDDLRRFVQERLDDAKAQPEQQLDVERLALQCETAVRNYDPCISCATHFLTLEIDRR